ncbi:GntR family transcriptional regulator [Loktanella sp. S4079]|uniref:GntR family transcriptional regulator n=1 Tax=Loktanella sp. S4079 TaxID=579483 RepID=UPI000696DFB2|nr:GntR family transcriptional regulator [Loktanella sp. S4079]
MKPISPPQSLMELTADRIREAIIVGELQLGSKVSEQRLADALSISRSPVREALALLQIEGLVRIFPKRGTFVFTPDEKTVLDLCDHRVCLESACLQMALDRAPDTLLGGMRQAMEDMHKAIRAKDAAAYALADMRFHRAIVTSSGNLSMARVYGSTIGPLMALRTHLFTEMHADNQISMDQHAALLAACEAGDIQQGQAIIERHVRMLADHYRRSRESAVQPPQSPVT